MSMKTHKTSQLAVVLAEDEVCQILSDVLRVRFGVPAAEFHFDLSRVAVQGGSSRKPSGGLTVTAILGGANV